MSFDRNQLTRLFDRMLKVKERLRWGSKKRLKEALNDWQKEDRLFLSQLKEAMRPLTDIEKIQRFVRARLLEIKERNNEVFEIGVGKDAISVPCIGFYWDLINFSHRIGETLCARAKDIIQSIFNINAKLMIIVAYN